MERNQGCGTEQKAKRTFFIGQIVRHFKGGLYHIEALANHTETGEPMVIYVDLMDRSKMWARPLAKFVSPVDKEKYPNASQDYRFEPMTYYESATKDKDVIWRETD